MMRPTWVFFKHLDHAHNEVGLFNTIDHAYNEGDLFNTNDDAFV